MGELVFTWKNEEARQETMLSLSQSPSSSEPHYILNEKVREIVKNLLQELQSQSFLSLSLS